MMDNMPSQRHNEYAEVLDSSVDQREAPGITWGDLGNLIRTTWARLSSAPTDPRVMSYLLVAIMLLAAAFRFTGVDWGEHQHLHPDERFLTMVENSLEWPKSLKEYFDTASNPLNPHNRGYDTYVYGLFPVAVAKFLAQVVGKTGYDGVYLVGRAMNGLLDIICVLLVFLTGKRLYDARVGLLGALLLSMSVLNIQQAHYFTVDTTTTLFVTLAMYLAVRVSRGGRWGSTIALGAAFGFAVSSKISVLSFLLIIGLAYLLRVLARWGQGPPLDDGLLTQLRGRFGRFRLSFRVQTEEGCDPATDGERLVVQVLGAGVALLSVLLVGFVVFRIAQPHAFLGPGFFGLKMNPKWKDNMEYIAKLVSGEIDYPPSHQWTGRAPVIFMLKNMVLWGQGLGLGLAVWASWALMGWEMLRKHKWVHLLPWVWLTFTFGYQSIQFVKVTRYLLPIYPTAALMAGYGLIWLWDRAKQQSRFAWWRRWGRGVSLAVILLVVVGTALWALAFTGIYTRPVTRIEASRWIYANLPKGSTISFELWDDPIPLNVDGRLASAEFQQIQIDLYWEDVPEKREKLYSWLDQIEYIALTSNRLYGSIPRLPSRYPMTTRYYQALFSGELGYDLYKTFVSRPSLFGIEIPDDNADESFTVYDHPKVLLFKKRSDFSLEQVRALFDGYELDRIVRVKPKQMSSAPNNLMLGDDVAVLQRQGGTWSEMFRRDSLANRLPTLTWLLALFVLGVIAFPLGFVAFQRLRDRGYVLSKTLGLLLLGYLSWLLPSLRLAPYTRWLILGLLLALAGCSAAIAWWQRRAIKGYLVARWRLLLVNEALFLAFFLLFWLIRRGNPDLWHPVMGGEKPMDLAYLNAIIKSSYFPPYDPWFAGGYLNYYYFGWVMVATLVKLTGIVPTVAYNLAIPTFFAMVAMGASCVVFNLIPASDDEHRWFPRTLRYGLLGALLVAVAGNLGEVRLLSQGLQELGQAARFSSTIPGLPKLVQIVAGLWELLFKGRQLPFRSEWWYWNASRIMKHGEINEFPFFTFLYADLHAHLTAMPFTLLALGLCTSLITQPARGLASLARDLSHRGQNLAEAATFSVWARARDWFAGLDWALWLRLTLLALVVGELWCNNSWDYPTTMGLSLVAIALGLYADLRREGRNPLSLQALGQLALRGGFVVLLSMVFFRPYHSNFGLAYSSVERWKGERTPLGDYLLIHGTFLFILTTYLLTSAFGRRSRNAIVRALRLFVRPAPRRQRAAELYALLVRCQRLGYEFAWLGIAFVALLLAIFLLTKAWVLLVGLPILVLAVALVFEGQASAAQRFQRVLVALGMTLTLAVEYIVLKGDIGRMNTVFKFYLQVWIMWGIASAVALAQVIPRLAQWRPSLARSWRTTLTILLVGVALYPICATYGKVRDRWDRGLPGGLDGTRYMTTARYHDNGRELVLESDRQAIVWMQDHIKGSPVILEANTPLYRWGGRVSIYTGLPSVIGWDWHQKQQRAAVDGIVVDWRLQDLRDLYNTVDTAFARRLLDRYNVGYVYVGELERAYYDANGLAKFEQMVGSELDVVYRRAGVTIYRVRGSGASEIAGLVEGPQIARLRAWLARHWIPPTVHADGPEKEPSGNLSDLSVAKVELMLDGPVDQLPILRDRGWNRWLAGSTLGMALAWWLVLQLVGLAAWPVAATVFSGFADKGYALSKGLGLLLVGYCVWLGSSLRLFMNSPPAAWLALLGVGVCSFFLLRRRSAELHALWGDLQGRKLILLEEALFTLAFAVFVGLRVLNPDLWQPWFGGEKMMEMAFLNAISKSAYMPPYDPYFAGGYINYYYYGLFLVSLLIKLTGCVPEVGFNLAVATFFALTVSHVFGLAYQLAASSLGTRLSRGRQLPSRSALWAGLAAVVMVAIMGNLTGVTQLLDQLAQAGGGSVVRFADIGHYWEGARNIAVGGAAWPQFDYWYGSTRVIPYTINEFPFFSFLFADLHPHMIGIPFTVLVVALCLTVSTRGQRQESSAISPSALSSLLTWGSVVICLGALGVINTWDLPTYWGLLGCCLLYRGYRQGGLRGVVRAIAGLLATALLSLVAYGPFYAHYRAQDVGLAWVVAGDRSPLGPFVAIWLLFVFLIVSLLARWLCTTWPWRRVWRMGRRRGWLRVLRRVNSGGPSWQAVAWAVSAAMVLVSVSFGLVLGLQGNGVLALAAPLALVCGLLVLWARADGAVFVQRLMVFVALAIWVGVEVIYLKDFLSGGDWRRMNTLFKFYIQAWVLLGIAGGAFLPRLWQQVGAGIRGKLWRGVYAFLLISSLVYTISAVPLRVSERFPGARPPWGTLDGTVYMTTGVYAWPDEDNRVELRYDRQAIEWLWRHVEGTPVIAEAALGYYRAGGLRVSSYTGLPTLVGMHEREQRPWDLVEEREEDVERLYNSTDVEELLTLLSRHRVTYVYVGQLERAVYSGQGLAKFDQLTAQGRLVRVYHNPKVDIYQVPADTDA